MPFDWEAFYREGRTPWDLGTAAPPLVAHWSEQPLHGDVLVPGCGSGHEVRAAAAMTRRVVGLDLAPGALALARARPAPAHVEWRLGDFFQPGPDLAGRFDWIVEHTLFCAIAPRDRTRYVAAAAEFLRPDGRLLALFWLDPGADPGPPNGVTVAELDALFAPAFDLEHSRVPAVGAPGRLGRELLRVLRRR